MATWRLAPTLLTLRRELDEEWPLRDKTSDGSLGNAEHSARLSDHNPDGRRIVCAIDVDEDLTGSASRAYPRFNRGQPAKRQLVDRLLKLAKAGRLPQLAYVIYERKIYSRSWGWAARAYHGVNAHEHHVHVSVRHEPQHADRQHRWNLWQVVPAAASKQQDVPAAATKGSEEDDDMPSVEDVLYAREIDNPEDGGDKKVSLAHLLKRTLRVALGTKADVDLLQRDLAEVKAALADLNKPAMRIPGSAQ